MELPILFQKEAQEVTCGQKKKKKAALFLHLVIFRGSPRNSAFIHLLFRWANKQILRCFHVPGTALCVQGIVSKARHSLSFCAAYRMVRKSHSPNTCRTNVKHELWQVLQEQNTAGFDPLGKASPRKQDLDWTLKKEKVLTSQGREESVSRRGRAQGKLGRVQRGTEWRSGWPGRRTRRKFCLYPKSRRKPRKFPQAGVYVAWLDLCSAKGI